MPPPKGVLCDLCGQKFFKHSLPIHRKQCAVKMANAYSECPKCLRRVSNDEYGKHVSECKIIRAKPAKIAPPKDVLCDICGQKFFKHSLPIHKKQCAVKYEKAFSECPKCFRRVSNDEYGAHVEECKIVREKPKAKPKATPQPKATEGSSKIPNSLSESQQNSTAAKSEEVATCDKEGDESSSDEEEKDARIACGFCRRKFNPDRISKHEKICQQNHSRVPRKQFKSSEQQRLEGTEFAKYKGARRQVDKPPSRWREDHARLLSTIQQGRLVDQFKASGIPLSMLPSPNASLEAIIEEAPGSSREQTKHSEGVPQGMTQCPHCSRTFNDSTAVKHIPKCKTTINRPKRLVRKSKPVLEKPKADFTKKIKDIVKAVLFSKKKKSDYFETKQAGLYREGERVMLKDGRVGEIMYIGQVEELFPGYWVGLCLESPRGQNNGSVDGRRYFSCPHNKGLFVRPSKLTKIPIDMLNQQEANAENVPESSEKTRVQDKPQGGSIAVEGTSAPVGDKDPRETCGACNRKFNPDRIAAHEKICFANKSKSKKKQAKSPLPSSLPKPRISVRKKASSVVERLREEVRLNSPRQEQS